MDKGRFSVEWLAQSSCGGARTVHRHLRDAQDSRPRDLGECRPPRRAGTAGVAAAEVTTVGANGRWGNGRRARGRRGSAAARAAAACVPAPLTGPLPLPLPSRRSRRLGAEQPRSGGGRRRCCRAWAAPHQVLGGAAAGAGAEFPRAALHRRQREAAPGRPAQPLPEPGERRTAGTGTGTGRPVKRPLGMASERITQRKTRRPNLFLTLSFLSLDKNLVSESPDEV